MPEKMQKSDKPSQGQTLSLRISDALYARLERAKQLMSSKKGDNVSTSEVAKKLLESAREDRYEVADLLANPTEALLDIRRKGEAQHIFSRAEWILLAHFVQKGLEAYTERTPNPVSNESLIGVLDAFVALYELRTERTSSRESYYLNNLPTECRPAKIEADDSERATSETVRRTVAETRKRISDPAVRWDTFLAGRNLLILLEDEKFRAADAVNRALRPFFPVLWRMAARGHYSVTQQSLRAKSASQDSFYQPPIPSIKEGDFTLSFNRGESNDIYLLLSFPGPRGPTYPINGYPKITEFRAMLAALAPDNSTRRWESGHFLGYVAASEESRGKDFWFRAHENGITFGLSEREWKSVQALFRRAWELPEIRMAWDALTLEYGEL
ncbi:MAG: hypothetical protein WBG02_07145 [Candidatus Acidiferrum sp.]